MKKARKNKLIYEQAITIENIEKMWKIIKKTCKNRREVFYFSLNLNTNIQNIYYDLLEKKYVPGKYKKFLIFEPKPRLVMSQTIYDKIVNHFVANFYLIPCIESSLIDANVATRKNRGSSYAMHLLRKYFNQLLIANPDKEIYCLKIDIHKYFYTIDHSLLITMLQRKIHDEDVVRLVQTILSETNKDYINESIAYYNQKYGYDIPFYKDGKGISIGAMSSQFLAIFYLNDLDHYIKEELRCKYYIRYMDDFVILDVDKDKLLEYWKRITFYVESLKLKTNSKSNIYRCSKGFHFLGYKYKVLNGKLIIQFHKKTFYKIKRHLKYLREHDLFKYKKTLASYYGYFKSIKKYEKGDFKMKSIEIYDAYKEKYKNTLILVKEGIFYHAYYEDGKILWYLFQYKYINNRSSFGNSPYDKVVDRLKELDLSFVVVSKEEELLIYSGDESVYSLYLELSKKSYDKYEKEEILVNKVKEVFRKNTDVYEDILNYLEQL